MRILRSCAAAFSMFSKIPVPQTAWEEDNMKYVLCFFPWIGAVIGLCMAGWFWVCRNCGIGDTAYLCISMAVPILATGGIHIDGFMDTMDALHSYQGRERKLEILKDPHSGAFSIIMLLLYYLIYAAAFSEIKEERALAVVWAGFFLSRVLSGLGVILLRPAKRNGSLRMLSDSAGKKTVSRILLIQLLLCAAVMLRLSFWTGVFAVMAAGGAFLYYRSISYKEFGGVTGDTAGYFVLVCEAAIAAAAALSS